MEIKIDSISRVFFVNKNGKPADSSKLMKLTFEVSIRIRFAENENFQQSTDDDAVFEHSYRTAIHLGSGLFIIIELRKVEHKYMRCGGCSAVARDES